jgi:hypothetical protein
VLVMLGEIARLWRGVGGSLWTSLYCADVVLGVN